jgi:3-deoxy-manno-octulosonate cytidylyltransferase (CMP-KDO synthetase)
MVRTLIVIPARLGSVRLPNKPLAHIGSKPMVIRVAEQAQKASVGDVLIACCEEPVATVAQDHGFSFVMTDPDLPSGTERVCAAYEAVCHEKDYDLVINLQGDLPTIFPKDLQKLCDFFTKFHPSFDVLTLGCWLEQSLYTDASRVKIAYEPISDNQAKALYFSRNTIPYGVQKIMCHIGVYGYSPTVLREIVRYPVGFLERGESLEQLRALAHGKRFGVQLINKYPPSVDTAQDLITANNYWATYHDTSSKTYA